MLLAGSFPFRGLCARVVRPRHRVGGLRTTKSETYRFRISTERRRNAQAGPIERMERTSPTRCGIEVPRLKRVVINRHERGSHGQDYYRWSGFGKAVDSDARGGRTWSGGVAQGTAS